MDRILRVRQHLLEVNDGPSNHQNLTPEPAAWFEEASAKVPILDEYDYIIVGAGSSGAVIAARLSEDKDVSVLLLEAGVEHNQALINIPATSAKIQTTELDWAFRSTPQKHLNNRISHCPRGKLLGGCSSINTMLYVRGHKEDFNSYARNGCDGWSYEEVLPYFKKSENCQISGVDEKYHGKQGPLSVISAGSGKPHHYAEWFIDAAAAAGIPRVKDYNAAQQIGVSISQHNIKDRVRCSTAHAFLDPIRATRHNLTIATRVHVTKVLFQGTTAIGVEFKRGSNLLDQIRSQPLQSVHCKREVIVCGGAINSPWLLQLSGVGPREWLEPLGIPVVADLPVGKNLQDHLLVPQVFEAFERTLPITGGVLPELERSAALVQYLLTKTGPLSGNGLDAMAFLQSGMRPDLGDAPDLQFHFIPVPFFIETLAPMFNWTNDFQRGKETPAWCITVMPSLLHPRSVGYLRLKSKDPFVYPELEFNYLEDKYDVDLLVHGMKLARKIAQQQPLKSKLGRELIEKTINHPPESEEYLQEYVRRNAVTIYHEVGTCKMGAVSDPTTVVDPRGRVKGVKGLRVFDASILPHLISGNTNAPAIMIGEKGSDIIKQDWANASLRKQENN